MELGLANGECAGLVILQHQRHVDERGSLQRLFDAETLASVGIDFRAIHINLTRTIHAGTVKGFHLQREPHAEVKIVTCIAGRILDVAVDLRPDSPTFGDWLSIELSPEKLESLLIPEGFAHGLQCLQPNSVVHYVHSAAYAPSAEMGVHPLDPDVAVAWPLPPKYLSQRDRSLPWLADFGGRSR